MQIRSIHDSEVRSRIRNLILRCKETVIIKNRVQQLHSSSVGESISKNYFQFILTYLRNCYAINKQNFLATLCQNCIVVLAKEMPHSPAYYY